MSIRALAVATVALAAVLGGCDPLPDDVQSDQRRRAQEGPHTSRTDTVGKGELGEEDPRSLPPELRGPYVEDTEPEASDTALKAVTAPSSPEEAARSYALLYTNWTWRSYRDAYARMQARATGRQQQRVARSSPASGAFLRFLEEDRVTNRGTVQQSTLLEFRRDRATVEVVVDELPGGRGQVPAAPLAHTYKTVVVRKRGWWLVDRFERQLESSARPGG